MEQSVLDMAGGRIRQQVNIAMEEALRNCMDWSTDAQKDRKLILTIKARPDKSRTAVSISADVQTRLAPDAPAETSLSILTEADGVVTIVENTPDIPGQMGFDGLKPIMRMESV